MTTILTETKRYFACPNGCDHKFYIEHLFETMKKQDTTSTRAGPWYCDACGHSWDLDLRRDGVLTLTPGKVTHRLGWVTLEIPAGSPAIRFRVRNSYLNAGEPLVKAAEHHRYFYEEHTCPTNWLRDVVEVEVEGDRDPHGFARYISTQLALDAVDICQGCGCTLSDGYIMDAAGLKQRGLPENVVVCVHCGHMQKGAMNAETPKKLGE